MEVPEKQIRHNRTKIDQLQQKKHGRKRRANRTERNTYGQQDTEEPEKPMRHNQTEKKKDQYKRLQRKRKANGTDRTTKGQVRHISSTLSSHVFFSARGRPTKAI